MFGLTTQIYDEVNRVRRRAADAARKSFSRTAFLIRKTAVESVIRARGASAVGAPVHTHKGNWFRRAIRYKANKEGAVIGPMFSIIGDIGQVHEFSGIRTEEIAEGVFVKAKYPRRPTMRPALDKNLDVFANTWSGSIGE